MGAGGTGRIVSGAWREEGEPMSEPAAASMSPWIVGPRYDLCFFSTLWLLPLLVLAPVAFEGFGIGAAFFYVWVYHLLIRLPHFAAMFRVTYLRQSQLPHYREHWLRYFAVPAAILALYGAPLLSADGYQSSFGQLLATVAVIWGYQHIGMQNYGVMQLYRMRAGAVADRAGVRFEKMIFYAIIVSVAAGNHLSAIGRSMGWDPIDALWPLSLAGLFGVLTAALISVYFLHLWRTGSFSRPMVLYFCVAVIAMVRWPLYDGLPAGSWFLVFNGHHSVAYLGLLFLMEWNQREAGRRFTFAAVARDFALFYAWLVAAALLLVLATMLYATVKQNAGQVVYASSLELLLGFFVVHYYIEALVWKFSRPHNRETTLPLLRPPAAF
jgi:hypothetical protein